jgi:acylphosphatase
MGADPVARRVVVRGLVQGVYFRDSTRQTAREAGVTGWVHNAADGTVQAHLEGPSDAVSQVVDFMRGGPPRAEVTDLDVADARVEGYDRFELR